MQLLYRVDGMVTTRKPKDLATCDCFEYEGKMSPGIRQFAKEIVTDAHELNLLKNDICFLMEELFGDRDKDLDAHRVNFDQVVTFYVWVCLPYPQASASIHPMQSSVFAFDLYHCLWPLSRRDINEVQNILRQDVQAFVHHRGHGEVPSLPFALRGSPVIRSEGFPK
jgi:hypothetical protein